MQNSDNPPLEKAGEKMHQRLLNLIRSHWHPQPVETPTVAEDLPRLSPVERSAESVCYGVKRLEHWVSPSGTIREWLRFNFWVAGMLAIPSLLVVPLMTYLLGSFASWTGFLVKIVGNLIVFPMLAIVCIATVSGIVFIGKAFCGK